VPAGALVFDPWVGSGTTLVEAALDGYQSFGIDLNPLSVIISNAKVSALTVKSNHWLDLMKQLDDKFALLARQEEDGQRFPYDDATIRARWGESTDYLTRWFTSSALTKVLYVLNWIESIQQKAIRGVLTICLSNILRDISLQSPEDLRIRRRREPVENPLVYTVFLQMVSRSIRFLLSFCLANGNGVHASDNRAAVGDSRQAASVCRSVKKEPEVVITSPPYCTALPYIDTDRLSLVLLGMLTPSELSVIDSQMIGSREIRDRQRESIEEYYSNNRSRLPIAIQRCIDSILEGNRKTPVGFRRRNTPALIARYFFDMQDSLAQLASLLSQGTACFIVVGTNQTRAGDELKLIETDRFLAELANDIGFRLVRSIPMDMLAARDIHRKNAIKSESILWLERT
jgi:site-specific DNA-methyltransferase (cytosine-N4-specific)